MVQTILYPGWKALIILQHIVWNIGQIYCSVLKATAVLFKIQGFHAHILLVVDEIFVHEKFSDKICCPSKTVNLPLFFTLMVIISCNNFIAIDPMKKFGARFSFSHFHGQKFSRQQELGLGEKITENMINIWIFSWKGIFANTYYTKLAFQTPQMISWCVPIVEIKIVFLNEITYSKIVM